MSAAAGYGHLVEDLEEIEVQPIHQILGGALLRIELRPRAICLLRVAEHGVDVRRKTELLRPIVVIALVSQGKLVLQITEPVVHRGRGHLLGDLYSGGDKGVPWAARRGRQGHNGAVRYPRLHISLPVRHGTDAATLEKSAGHLYGTSLPVGGESTHVVVAAHRGLADRLMFTNLGFAKKGDLFEIDVQGERLYYKVTDIRVTGPDDVKPLAIEKGRDLVTLYTCTPYGVNTQRLLVTGERTDAPSGGDPGPVERLPDWLVPLVPLVPLWGLLGVSVGRAIRGPRRRPGRHAKRN